MHLFTPFELRSGGRYFQSRLLYRTHSGFRRDSFNPFPDWLFPEEINRAKFLVAAI